MSKYAKKFQDFSSKQSNKYSVPKLNLPIKNFCEKSTSPRADTRVVVENLKQKSDRQAYKLQTDMGNNKWMWNSILQQAPNGFAQAQFD